MEGLLRAQGVLGDSIYFQALNENVSWNGIDLQDYSSYFNVLNYCVISGSISSGLKISSVSEIQVSDCRFSYNTSQYYGGGIRMISLDSNINRSTFSHNDNYALYIEGLLNDTIFSNLIIKKNNGGIMVDDHHAAFEYCIIDSNYSDHTGAGIYAYSADYIYKSVITNNIAANSGAGIAYHANLDIINCTIAFNEAYYNGSGVACLANNNPHIVNTILAFNSSPNTIYISSYEFGPNSYMRNNCFYNNDTSIANIFDYDLFLPDSINANNDSCDYRGNIFIDPEFIDNYYDVHLSSSSPCINAGDPNTTPDEDNTVADIGAYYHHLDNIISVENNDISVNINIYPNPSNSIFTINTDSHMLLSLYNINGKCIINNINNNIGPATIDLSNYSTGIYYLTAVYNNTITTHKLVLIK